MQPVPASHMSPRVPLDASDAAVTRRMRALRHLLCGSGYGAQSQFAERMGIDRNVWNNIEYGKPVSRFVARAIWENYPEWVSLDWIYFGDESAMLREVVAKIAQAMTEIEDR